MRPRLALGSLGAAALLLLGGQALGTAEQPPPPPTGFSAARWDWERTYEEKLKQGIKPESCHDHLRFLTDQPHVAGTPGNFRVSQYVHDRFLEYGLETEFAEYDVLLAYPEEVRVEIVGPEPVMLAHSEPVSPLDPHTDPGDDPLLRLPWNAYAASADLEAPVIYGNYGRMEDYAQLEASGVDLKGKIVLVRYFHGYRGGKSFNAEKYGIAGLLVYSDPMEDGYFQGDTWPHGPWGPMGHFQRGANVYDFLVPGDPLTPGWASVPGAKRLEESESVILPKIPMVPLSAPDAAQILERIGGPAVPLGWQGALPLTYHLGGGNLRIHLVNKQRRVRTKIRNVIGRIRGSEFPDQIVLLSNHTDAWVYGAVDPSSGTASLLELARVLGALAKEGFHPRRTIVFGSWDSEEYTLTGSTEWGEQFADKLEGKTLACLNVDASTSGADFSVGASPLLRRFIIESTQSVRDPLTDKPVYDRWAKAGEAASVRSYVTGAAEAGPPIGRLGSGSDYTVFFNRLGIPSLDMIFDGPYGVYHSIYDNFYWMDHFGDPGFRFHAAMSRMAGVMALRLANADLIPYAPGAYADEIETYVEEFKSKVPARFYAQHLEPIQREARALRRAASQAEARWHTWMRQPEAHKEAIERANDSFLHMEGEFLQADGLPDRPWFKHLLYAPLPSYEAEVLPGVTERLRAGDFTGAAQQAERVRVAVERLRKRVEAAR